jgi:opacity protein-like surface antigen
MRRLLLLAVMVFAAAMVLVAPSAAAPPQDMTISIDEVFHATGPPFVTGVVTASGGVFGEATTGTLESQSFSPVGGPHTFPPPHVFEYTAVDQYTFDDGSFLITFQAACYLVSFDPDTGDIVLHCSGNWRVNGGTGDYALLKGTGKFTEQQVLDGTGAGTGTVTEVGKMQSG